MNPRHRTARRDANEVEIVKALRKLGVKVWTDLPVDLLCFHRGRLFCVEVKDGSKPPSARKLTDREREFIEIVGDCCTLVEDIGDISAVTEC